MKKDRITELRVDFGKDVIISGMYHDEDGTLIFYDEKGNKLDPKHIETGSSYNRDSGKLKTLNRYTPNPDNINTNPFVALTKYKYLYVIDTNTKIVNSIKYSISVSLSVRYSFNTKEWNANIYKTDTLIIKSPTLSGELTGWLDLLDRITNNPTYLPSDLIGIITDYELDKLTKFNLKELPLIDNFFLPDNVEFIYASADVGMDFPANKLIRECDKLANEAFNTQDLSKI